MLRASCLAALLLAWPAAAAPLGVRLPTVKQLAEAVRGGDEVEIERVARRIGAARLLRAALAGIKEERLAVLRALPLTDGAWALLTQLAAVLLDADAEVAAAAARAARRIAEQVTPQAVFAEEIPPDVPRGAARSLWAVAARRELAPSVRTAALAAAASLSRLKPAPADPQLLDALLADPIPEVRRAAVEALGPGGGAQLARAVLDIDPAVAAAAGAGLCAGVPPPGARAPSEKLAAALAEPARARIRSLAADPSVAVTDRLDLIPCLRAFASPADRSALDALAGADVEPIRRRARAYGGRGKTQ